MYILKYMQWYKRFLLIIAFIIFTPHAFAEEITSFDQNTTINQDGTIRVTESILYDFDTQNRHGIYRTIPTTKTNTENKTYVLTFTDISVADELGSPYTFKRSDSGSELKLQIGDANRTITGQHTYVISYTVSGALTYFSDHDELYWNVTGDGWDVPIQKAKSTVNPPPGVGLNQIQAACYLGAHGSTANSTCSTQISDHSVVTTSTTPLGISEGLTTVVGFPKGIVSVLEPKEETALGDNPLVQLLIVLVSGMWYLVLPAYIGIRWWKQGKDPKPTIGQANVWFSPPKDSNKRELTPGETGTLLDERVDMKDITATLVDLARRGYFHFVEEKKGFLQFSPTIQLIKDKDSTDDSLLPFEKKLLSAIFATQDQVKNTDLKLADTVSEIKEQLYTLVVKEKYFYSNPETVRTLFTVLGVFGLMTGNILLLISSLLFGRNMPKKTQLGANQAAIAKALRGFITSQEHQYTFQAKEYFLFEKMLPYAIAFGVEKIWAERFEHLDLDPPGWYQGNWNTYNSLVFVNSLSSSLSSVQSAMTPTSSSTGHSSGFSGGFSGGGGGGGGGGSW
jgi:hypothetical protein